MTRQNWPAYSAVAGFATVALGCLIALWMQRPLPERLHVSSPAPAVQLQTSQPSAMPLAPPVPAMAGNNAVAGAAPMPSTTAANPPVQAAGVQSPSSPAPQEASYYSQLRSRMRWVPTTVGGDKFLTPDLDSRLLLAKSAARRAGLGELGLSFKDVYGIINAETSWVPRPGASKDGTPNLGIAQFEPATARALGLRNPQDAVEAVHVAAVHIKEAALWSADRIAGLKLGADQRAAKLREGISIYYNLSTRARNTWNGRNTEKLPRETQLHIQNARVGAQQAEFFDMQLQAMNYRRGSGAGVVTASSSGR